MDDSLRARDWEDLTAYTAGADARFRAIHDRHARQLSRVAYGVLLDASEARDVVQEAFVRLHQDARTLPPGTDVGGWLYRVTMNLALSTRRTLTAWGRRKLMPSALPSPEAVATGNRASEQLARALERLPARQRAVVALSLDADLSPAQIAEALGITPNAARVNLHRAISTLRSELRREQVDLPFDDVVVEGVEE